MPNRLPEHAKLGLGQLGARLHPELVQQPLTDSLVDLERLDLPSRTRQR